MPRPRRTDQQPADDPHTPTGDVLALRQAYDDQLRAEAELATTHESTRHGPVLRAVFRGCKGFVTYRDLADLDERGIDRLVAETLEHYRAAPRIERVEWKTRGHDRSPGLHEALVSRGFVPGEPEAVMIGRAEAVAHAPEVPGVEVRRVTSEEDVRAMCACADEAFGQPAEGMADGLVARLAAGDPAQLWVAEVDGRMVSTGRLEPVAGTDFAGLWGGATLPGHRRRGIYRALLAARARSALQLGHALLQSDSTEHSRPILERSGFVQVTTTTPYEWRR